MCYNRSSDCIIYFSDERRNKFKRKGKEVIDANIKAISLVPDYIKKVSINKSDNSDEEVINSDLLKETHDIYWKGN